MNNQILHAEQIITWNHSTSPVSATLTFQPPLPHFQAKEKPLRAPNARASSLLECSLKQRFLASAPGERTIAQDIHHPQTSQALGLLITAPTGFSLRSCSAYTYTYLYPAVSLRVGI
ncbi:hypothetical protein ACJQWK_09350 [Exserohilum turcicum]